MIARKYPDALDQLRQAGYDNQLATCCTIDLEILYSARDREEFDVMRSWLADLPHLASDDRTDALAVELQSRLAEAGQHRLPVTDLLIAATAARHGAEVVHYDKHFDLIAAVGGPATRWIVPRGSAK